MKPLRELVRRIQSSGGKMTHKHNFIRQIYSRGTDDSTKHHLVQCAGCGLSAPDPAHEDLALQYQAACESIERTRSDPDAVAIMTRDGWRLLGQLILKDELNARTAMSGASNPTEKQTQ
jgi:hypothetical protein